MGTNYLSTGAGFLPSTVSKKSLTSKHGGCADLQVALQVTLQVLNVGVSTWPERTSLKHLGHLAGDIVDR